MNSSTVLNFIPAKELLSKTDTLYIPEVIDNKRVRRIERYFLWSAIKFRIFYFACIILKSPKKIWATFKVMLSLRSNVWGGDLKKIYKIGGKYYKFFSD